MQGPDVPPTRQELHAIIDAAMARLRANPRDTEAEEEAAAALDALREYARPGGQGEREAATDVRRYTDEAMDPGVGVSTAMGVARNMSAGLGDEAAGVVTAAGRLLPGGESPGRAYRRGRDSQRAFQDMATAAHPWADLGGDVAGTLAMLPLSAAAKVPTAIRAASREAATVPERLAALREAMLIGGSEGALQGFGRAEEHPVRDAAVGGLLGAGLSGFLAARGLTRARAADKASTDGQLRVERLDRERVLTENARLRQQRLRRQLEEEGGGGSPVAPEEARIRRITSARLGLPQNHPLVERYVANWRAAQSGATPTPQPRRTTTPVVAEQAPPVESPPAPDPRVDAVLNERLRMQRAISDAIEPTPVASEPVAVEPTATATEPPAPAPRARQRQRSERAIRDRNQRGGGESLAVVSEMRGLLGRAPTAKNVTRFRSLAERYQQVAQPGGYEAFLRLVLRNEAWRTALSAQ